MIKHFVMLKKKPATDDATVQEIMDRLEASTPFCSIAAWPTPRRWPAT
jgi:hypothetical protein